MHTKKSSTVTKFISFVIISILILIVVPVNTAFAATDIYVATTTDEIATNATNLSCSLREAIVNANTDSATYTDCADGTGADTIYLHSGDTYVLTQAQLIITDLDGLTITTDGALPATIDAGGSFRVIRVDGGDLTLDNIIVQNGSSSYGSGLRFDSTGVLTLMDSSVLDNSATATSCGAGIYSASASSITITGSSIANNTCTTNGADGGGIFYQNVSGSFDITNSTFYNNSAGPVTGGNGGGMDVDVDHGTIDFSTFSNNTVSGNGGAAKLSSVGTITISNSILANSNGGADCWRTSGAVDSSTSLIETNPPTGVCGNPVPGFNSDPGLGIFQDNGGSTFTMSITDTSPAYDAAGACSGVDQRGTTRPQDSACDLGAFELAGTDPALTATSTSVVCSTPVTYGSDSSCQVTVTPVSGDVSGASVTWSSDNSGSFTTSPCTLVDNLNGTASCSVTYTPGEVGDGTHWITATYSGDSTYAGSIGTKGVTVDQKELTVTGVTADDKEYDGTADATWSGTPTPSGMVGSDVVGIDSVLASAAFDTADVGTGKAVTASGFALNGADAGNYTLAQPTGLTAAINARAITVTAVTDTKVYDGTADSSLTPNITIGSIATGDTANFTQSFDSPDVAASKTLAPSGSVDDGNSGLNYDVTFQNNTTGEITAKELTVTGVTANDREYDGTTDATLSGSASLVGVLLGESVSLGGTPGAAFADKNVGAGKSVTVTGYTIGGPDAGNYTLTQPTGLTAEITAKGLTITGIAVFNKTYDNTTAATLSGSPTLSGVASGDTVNLGGTPGATFADANVGSAKAVTVTGYTISGADAGNYTLTQPAGLTADINALAITVTAMTDTKVYDGTADSSLTPDITIGSIATGDIPNFTQSFGSSAVGTNKTLTPAGSVNDGNSGLNYAVTFQNNTTGEITAKELTVTGLTANNKVYDGTPNATLSGTPVLVGVVGSEEVGIDSGSASSSFDTKDVGTGKAVTASGYALNGADAGNYVLTQPTGLTADITAKELTIINVAVENKVYDGSSDATLSGTASLVGVVGSEDVGLDTGSANGSFDTPDAGTGKPITVSGFVLNGADAGNYTLTQPTGLTADITPAELTVTADDKNKNQGDPDPVFSYGVTGFVNLDTFTTFPTCDVLDPHDTPGTYAITCSSADAGTNYTITYVAGTLTVTGPNQPPTDITLSNDSVEENQPVGTLVGTFTTTDPDVGDTFTYSFTCDIPGVDDASFTIDADMLRTAEVFDFETKDAYSICVRTDDGNGGTFDKDFGISITNSGTVRVTFKSQPKFDGWVLESNETSGVGGTKNNLGKVLLLGDNAQDKQYRAILSFGTAKLPDNAVITKVILKVKKAGVAGTDPMTTHNGLVVDIKKGKFYTLPALQINDFQAKAKKYKVGKFPNKLFSGWYRSFLNSGAYGVINLKGRTQLRLRFLLDDNDDNSADILKLYSGNAVLANRPTLIVDYYIP